MSSQETNEPKKRFPPHWRKKRPQGEKPVADTQLSPEVRVAKAEPVAPPSGTGPTGQTQPRMGQRHRHNYSNADRAAELSMGEQIRKDIRKGYECMVCMSEIKFYQAVWSCKTCYKLFHMSCTHEWIRRNTPKTKSPSEPFEWRCPGCQYVYLEPELPKYKCFCGRVDNPPPSRQSPFSCGEPCCIPRTLCTHPCVLPCHPGSCPPCQVLLPKQSCFCGQDPADGSLVKCGHPNSLPHGCGSVCGRVLNCGRHACEASCHPECEPCRKVTGTVSCFCGSERRDIKCGSSFESRDPFSCNKLSPVMMDCDQHEFLRKCGDSDRSCPLNIQTCACGLTPASKARTSCSDPLEYCTNKKEIKLGCGHEVLVSCRLPDHLVPSNSAPDPIVCNNPVTQFCHCTRAKRTVACSVSNTEPFLCTQPCRTLKTCGKCKCDIVCCPDFGRKDFGADSHICYTVCDKLLNCGTHRCDEIHHLGHCKRCQIIIREPVSCGCGKTVLNPPFQCGTLLPACNGLCNKELACGHRDLSRCHTGPCAPCTILVSKPCAGGHQNLHQIPCFAENIACNLKCGKLLSCGQHRDKAGCHAGGCQLCNQPCGEKLKWCEHECQLPCGHSGPGCWLEPCKARIIAACGCGLRTEEVQCRGCESLPFPVTPTLQCSSECAIAQRQAALRQAFKPEDVAEGELAEQYSGELVSLAEKNDKFVRLLDSALVDAAASRARTLNLPPTDQTKRYLTLEYVQIHYRFEAEVVKEGDNLHVCVHFVPGETRVPRPTLSALLDMLPSQTLRYIVDFDPEGPQIHLYDVARGFGRMTVEKVNRELKQWVGSYRTRRGEGFNLYLDFFDANKAVAAFRKIQTVSGLEQSRLLNVLLLEPKVESHVEDAIVEDAAQEKTPNEPEVEDSESVGVEPE